MRTEIIKGDIMSLKMKLIFLPHLYLCPGRALKISIVKLKKYIMIKKK